MQTTTRRIEFKPPYTFGLRLMSDLHFGGKHVDYNLIQKEFDQAQQKGYRIAINGDVFDAILPGDRRRFRMSGLHPRLLAAGDRQVDTAINWAYEVMKPCAHLIDMIGIGNHDDAVIKHHSTDPIMRLIEKLNDRLAHCGFEHRVAYGDYCGFLGYAFYRRCHGPNRWRFVDSLRVAYHHGSGGSAPVTKGMIDFNRMNVWVNGADVCWKGHKHNKFVNHDRVVELDKECLGWKDRPRLNIMTGAYGDEYVDQEQSVILSGGRNVSYAADAYMAPQGKGGYLVKVEFDRQNTRTVSVEDSFVTEVTNSVTPEEADD